MTILTAMPGDTVAAVAIRAGVDPALLAEQNGLAPQTPLVPGQALVSRRPVQVYTVQPGDTLALRVDPWNIQVFDAQTERNLCCPVRKEDAQ